MNTSIGIFLAAQDIQAIIGFVAVGISAIVGWVWVNTDAGAGENAGDCDFSFTRRED